MDYRVSIAFTDVFAFTMYKTRCQTIKSKGCIIIIIITTIIIITNNTVGSGLTWVEAASEKYRL